MNFTTSFSATPTATLKDVQKARLEPAQITVDRGVELVSEASDRFVADIKSGKIEPNTRFQFMLTQIDGRALTRETARAIAYVVIAKLGFAAGETSCNGSPAVSVHEE